LARVATSRTRRPASVAKRSARKAEIASRPWYSSGCGGIVRSASSVSSSTTRASALRCPARVASENFSPGLPRHSRTGTSDGSFEVVGALAGGVLCAVLFVVWELRAREPMLPMRLFGVRGFASGNAAGLLMFGALFSAVFFMAQFQQTALGQSPLQAGLRLIPWTGTVFIVAPLAGALVDRVGERPLLVSGLLMQAVGLAWVALLARTRLAYVEMVPPLVLAGVGISMALPAAQNAVMGAVAPSEIGKASGTFSTMRQLGGAFGLAVAVAVFTATGSYASPGAFSDGFGPAIAVSAALSLCGALAGTWLRVRGVARAAPAFDAAGGR